jgi:hypothetical protein
MEVYTLLVILLRVFENNLLRVFYPSKAFRNLSIFSFTQFRRSGT